MARLGTPEAITALIQARLFPSPNSDVVLAVDRHLEVLMARLDGEEKPFDTWPWSGWRQERFGRLP